MRRSLTLMTVVLAVLLLATGCKNKPPLTPVRPAGPDSVALNTAATYTSWTTDPNRDDIRYVFDWDEMTDGAFDTSGYLPSGDTMSLAHTWTAVGTYALRAKAQDENGNWSADWSDTHHVYVYSGSGNNPPAPPAMPVGPDSVWVNVYAAFSSSSSDPDGDSVQLRFYWGDDMASGWSAFMPGGTTVRDSTMYTFRGAKQVYAVARDTKGDTSAWSDPAAIAVYAANTAPGKPVVTGPDRGIKDGPKYLFYGRASDPEGDNLDYKFFWGNGASSNWTAASPHSVPVPESTSYAANGTYSIRCIARDIDGLMSDTSDPHVFSVVGERSILWGVSTGECVSSPAWATLMGGRPGIVIGNTEGYLIAVDAWQGDELYREIVTDEPFTSSPAVSDNGATVYIGSGDGRLFAFDNEGDQKWTAPYPDTASGEDLGATPAIDGSAIYCAGEAGYVFKVTDGGASATPAWMVQMRDEVYASPVLAGGNLIVCDDSGYVYFLNPANGSEATAPFLCDGRITSTPAIGANGNIHVGTDQGTMYAISPTGTLVWSRSATSSPIVSSPVIAGDGGIVFGADDGYLYKLDPTTGQAMSGWPVLLTTGDLVSAAAVCADGVIYIASDDDRVYAVRENGSLYWADPVELILPSIARKPRVPRRLASDDLSPSVLVGPYGIIYVASVNDGLFAIAGRTAGTLATTSWPMFHHDVRHSGKAGSW